jgi:hypothetical protein
MPMGGAGEIYLEEHGLYLIHYYYDCLTHVDDNKLPHCRFRVNREVKHKIRYALSARQDACGTQKPHRDNVCCRSPK